MVFKFLQTFPLGIKSLLFQFVYALILFALVSFLEWSRAAFLAGFLFSQVYMLFFFYSVFFLFQGTKIFLGLFLMFFKWLLLFLVLIAVSWFLESKSFLLGLSGLLSFLLCYVFENLKRKTIEETLICLFFKQIRVTKKI